MNTLELDPRVFLFNIWCYSVCLAYRKAKRMVYHLHCAVCLHPCGSIKLQTQQVFHFKHSKQSKSKLSLIRFSLFSSFTNVIWDCSLKCLLINALCHAQYYYRNKSHCDKLLNNESLVCSRWKSLVSIKKHNGEDRKW